MKTSIEMQLKILDKMRENVESSKWLFDQIQYSSRSLGWIDKENSILDFMGIEYRIKPQTITINGVDIPKPLDVSEIIPGGHYYFMPCLSANLCAAINGYDGQKFEHKLLYATKEEAIEVSKLLFGIKG